MRDDRPHLYHVTTRDAAERIRDEGYAMQDWATRFRDWNLSLEFDTDAWAVPDAVDSSLVGVALAERILEEERLAGHPSRSQAGFFYSNPWTARENMVSGSFGNTCVVVCPRELNGSIAYGRAADVGPVFSFCLDAAEYRRRPLESVSNLRERAATYWTRVFEWNGNAHPRAEVFVPAETGVPPEAVERVVADPSVLADAGREGEFKRYNDDAYAAFGTESP